MESKDITVKNETTAIVDTTNYKEVAIQWLTSTGKLKDFNENEKNQFIDMCTAFHLNPIKREVHGIKYKGKNGFPDTFNIVIGYEVYLKRADRTGKMDGFNVECRKFENDMIATCTIYRKDWTHPFIHSVLLSEYHQHNKMWNEKPVTMIKKVATEQAFRLCFPDEMGGLPYGEEELPSENMSETTPIEKDITPVKSSVYEQKTEAPKKTPKYTTEQAKKLGAIMNTLDGNSNPVFSDKEKDVYREMLIAGKFEHAMEEAEKLLKERIATDVDVVAIQEVGDPNLPIF